MSAVCKVNFSSVSHGFGTNLIANLSRWVLFWLFLVDTGLIFVNYLLTDPDFDNRLKTTQFSN